MVWIRVVAVEVDRNESDLTLPPSSPREILTGSQPSSPHDIVAQPFGKGIPINDTLTSPPPKLPSKFLFPTPYALEIGEV